MARIRHGLQITLVAVGLMASGCAPMRPPAGNGKATPGKPPPAQTQTAPIPSNPPPPPAGYRLAGDDPLVKERLALYLKKRDEWRSAEQRLLAQPGAKLPDAWGECRRDIDQALAGYRQLRQNQGPDSTPWRVMAIDVGYFEKNCDRVLLAAQAREAADQEAQAPPPTPAIDPAAIDRLRQDYQAGQYQETVSACEALTRGANGQPAPDAVREYWGRALAKLGRFQEAAGVLAPLAQEGAQRGELSGYGLKELTADLLFASGQNEEARQAYAEVAQALTPAVGQQAWADTQAKTIGQPIDDADLTTYRQVMRAYLRFDGHRVPQAINDGVAALEARAAGPTLAAAQMILAKATAESQAWAQAQLAEVQRLIDAGQPDKARLLLDQVSAAAPDGITETINQLQAKIAAAQTAQAASGGEPATSPWDEAMRLMAQRRYDEAIAALQPLTEGDRGAEAKAKINEAQNKAANAMRQQAAALYAKARNTPDPEARAEALRESRALVQGLIDRYPDTLAATKARQNLKMLDAELSQTPAPASPPPVNPGQP